MSPRLSVRRKTPPLAPANVQMEPTKLPGFKNCIRFIHSAHSNSSKFDPLGNCWQFTSKGKVWGVNASVNVMSHIHVCQVCRCSCRFSGFKVLTGSNGLYLETTGRSWVTKIYKAINQRIRECRGSHRMFLLVVPCQAPSETRKSLNVYSRDYRTFKWERRCVNERQQRDVAEFHEPDTLQKVFQKNGSYASIKAVIWDDYYTGTRIYYMTNP